MASWGDWMTGWKADLEKDTEADRVDRQKAAFGAETLAKLKDINVLIVGLRGVGVETAKNLILSNVGGVVVWDPEPTQIRDLGSNFYLTEAHAAEGTPRAEASLGQLKSLNPYCKVDSYSGPLSDEFLLQTNVNGTGKPFSAVVATRLLPKEELFRINQTARNNRIAFILSITTGVTSSIFSDFGPQHVITDPTGEPLETKALSNIEVIAKPAVLRVSGVEDGDKIVVLSCDSNHGISDGDRVELDDLHGGMESMNGKQFKVKHLSFNLYDPKREVALDKLGQVLKESTGSFADVWGKKLASAKADYEAEGGDPAKWKSKLRELTLLDRLVLVLDDAAPENFDGYQFGGLVNPVKEPVSKAYGSLEESLVKTPGYSPDMHYPKMLLGASSAEGEGIECHLAYAATLDFYAKFGRWPRQGSGEDANSLVEIAQSISDARKGVEAAIRAQKFDFEVWGMVDRDLNETRIKRFARLFGTELTGFCAYLGGATAQEVIKKTGKFTPIDQWIHHEDTALVADESASNTGPPMFSRYDDQIAILGKDFQAKAANTRVFLVGCGALGCEYLKGMAMMGVGVGERGQVVVTDMDTIETSNLSRQFLFRAGDVGSSKSTTGARVVKGWNPALNVQGIEKFVGPSTEEYFNDEFWTSLDVCWNALDNVKARKYTDGRCLWYSKPLLESGTMGTKTNHEVILPFRTQTYNDIEDPPQVGIAMCTLRSFPFLPIHCIEYAKQALYTENFEFGPSQYESFRTDKQGFFISLDDMSKDSERMEAMSFVKQFVDLQKAGPIDFGACVRLAFAQLMKHFRHKILDVVNAGDTQEAKSGKSYWTGTKRKPNPVEFSLENARAMEFLYATTNMYAFVWGAAVVRDRSKFSALVGGLGLKMPEYDPSGAKIQEGEDDEAPIDPKAKAALKHDLENNVDVSRLQPATPHDFEKDDDDNFHIDYVTASTNLRAWNYNIKSTPRHAVKVTAGRIIPALATTTAMICGVVDIEFCKLIMGLSNAGTEKFLNSNINLALGAEAFNAFHPEPPLIEQTNVSSFSSFTSWDKLELNEGGQSIGEVTGLVKKRYGAKVTALSAETNYRPAKSAPLWKEGESTAKKLSEVFWEKMALGEERADRSADNRKRMRSELKKLEREPLEGFTHRVKPDDDFVLQFKLKGPEGTPYEGGLFLIEVKVPHDYPNVPPLLSFLTPIEHCNILDGVPCPNLLFGVWSPALSVHSVLQQLVQLLKEQSKSDALVPSLASMDDDVFFAHAKEATKKNAVEGQEFPETAKKPSEEIKWPHSYIILKGEFENDEGKEAFLPRIKFHMSPAGSGSGKGKQESAAASAACKPVDEELAKKISELDLELDGSKMTFVKAYIPDPVRAAQYVAAVEGLTVETCVCVTCELDGEVVETIVASDTLEHKTFVDTIFYEECTLPSFVEAQFEEGGPWVLGRGNSEVVGEQKNLLFNIYAKEIGEKNPHCLSTLRRMLQGGPITRVYTGGGKPPHVPSHEGFVLRMPAEQVEDWTMVNDKGELVDIPRPALGIRVWNAKTLGYDGVDPVLDGAPTTPEETDAWFIGVVKTLKASPYIGGELLDLLATSVRHTDMEKIQSGEYEGAFEGEFSNHWTDLVINN